MRTEILGIPVDGITENEASALIFDRINGRSPDAPPYCVVTPNPLMIMESRKNSALRNGLLLADLSLPDGNGLVSAAKRAGTPLPGRTTGIGTAEKVIEKLAETKGSVYILGALPGRADEAAGRLAARFPGLVIAGTRDGYFDAAAEKAAAAEISRGHPDLLCVCMGGARQTSFVFDNLKTLSGVGCAMGLGGSADVWSGKIRRAPRFFIKIRAEWLWRMLAEPRRFSGLGKLIAFRILTRRRLFGRKKRENTGAKQ